MKHFSPGGPAKLRKGSMSMFGLAAVTLFLFAPLQAQAVSQGDRCGVAARVAGFALHARASGTSEIEAKQLVALAFTTDDYSQSSDLAERVIENVYDFPENRVESMKPIDKEAIEAFELGTFRRCIDDQW